MKTLGPALGRPRHFPTSLAPQGFVSGGDIPATPLSQFQKRRTFGQMRPVHWRREYALWRPFL